MNRWEIAIVAALFIALMLAAGFYIELAKALAPLVGDRS